MQKYKRNNRIVISFAGSKQFEDFCNDISVFRSHIPAQYGDAESLYNSVKSRYPNAIIESVGYSFGGTLANLLAHRTGISSTVIAPIGSQHIVDKHKDYFKYDDSNITTYGRKGDILFNTNLKRQSGNLQVMPDLHNKNMFNWVNNHLLDTMTPIDIFQAKPTGFAAPITDDFGTEHIFTPDEIGNLSFEQFNKYEKGYYRSV